MTEMMLQIDNFIIYIQSQIVFQRIFNFNISLYAQILLRTNKRKHITAYDLFRKQIIEEGHLINVTDRKIINLSTNKIWMNLSPAEKGVFHNYAIQLRSIIEH
ncbi:27589_t:CDS:1 [Gigaspora margarita]|uniref:27589_t:CDS:1 n=1 Tax=Gigaspora margarita TaxID=4874 RepID=A0ABN7WLU4_GIGMA|nr:27589_t:CDS:1 [Gigaspora margarita]